MKKFNLDIPKIGYIIAYKNNGRFFGNQIVKAQITDGFNKEDAEFVHVEMSLGGQWSINAKMPKIVISDITKFHKGRHIKILRPKIKNYSEHRKNVAIHCLTRVNVPYGILGVVWFKLKKVLKTNILSSIGDFCSELVGYGLWTEYQENILPKPYGHMFPADYLNKEYFEEIWEGVIG